MTSVGFNLADVVILAIILLSALISLFRGFVREALSLVSWILAFWLALGFSHPLSDLLVNYIKSPTLRIGAAFVGIFILVLIICAVINHFITALVHSTGLSGTDRLLGAVFGLIRGVLLVAALLLVARLTTPMQQEDWWQGSMLIQHFEPVEIWLQGFIPQEVIEHFKLSKQ
ncbi:MAG TPA: CvpA family protein [Gammaproteobacteria bacterium]|nr:CvpA family protein [Gammaproteobacteria bacterium]